MQTHGIITLLRRNAQKPVISHRAIARQMIIRGLIVLGALSVAGCSSNDAPPPTQICPHISAFPDAEMLTKFAIGTGRDLTDVDHEIKIVDIRYGCTYTEDENENPILAVAVAPVFAAERGPANSDRQARFTYYVAIAGPKRTILNKQTFDLQVNFPGNRSRVTVSPDDPPVTIDIPPVAGRSGPQYHVFVGLQLTPDELEYNRRRRGAAQ